MSWDGAVLAVAVQCRQAGLEVQLALAGVGVVYRGEHRIGQALGQVRRWRAVRWIIRQRVAQQQHEVAQVAAGVQGARGATVRW